MVLNLGLPVYTEFPCPKIFPVQNFQKCDYLYVLAHTCYQLHATFSGSEREKEMIPYGWNMKREASNKKYDFGAIGNTQHDHGPSSGQFFSPFSYILKCLTFMGLKCFLICFDVFFNVSFN